MVRSVRTQRLDSPLDLQPNLHPGPPPPNPHHRIPPPPLLTALEEVLHAGRLHEDQVLAPLLGAGQDHGLHVPGLHAHVQGELLERLGAVCV